MVDLLPPVLLAAGLGGARWLLRAAKTVPVTGGLPQWAPTVSIVIPARDEAATLPALLASVRQLTVDVCEVVVVDDDSRDATAAVARSFGARVVTASAPPTGWTGKAWACQLGADLTFGDRLLFLDADTTLAPYALDGLLGLLQHHRGLISVQPFHRAVRPYEQLSAYCNAVAVLAGGAFAPHRPRRAAAYGPCLLTSRADYERAGGHAAVRADILDDVRLAAAYRRAALPVTCALGGRAVQMRSYPGGMAQLAEGWTKNLASGSSATAPLPALAAVAWVCAHHMVARKATRALIDTVRSGEPPPEGHPLAVWGLAWAAVVWQLRSVLRRVGSFRWWTWALFPVPLLAFDSLFAVSALLTAVRRSVRWRGRTVDLGARAAPAERH